MIIALEVICLVATVLMSAGVLAHRGSGGGMSDLLGGGSSLPGSAHANRNLTRLTIACTLVWAASVLAIGLLNR